MQKPGIGLQAAEHHYALLQSLYVVNVMYACLPVPSVFANYKHKVSLTHALAQFTC